MLNERARADLASTQLWQAVVGLLIWVLLPLLLLAPSYIKVNMPDLSLAGLADHRGCKSAWCPRSGWLSSVSLLSTCRGPSSACDEGNFLTTQLLPATQHDATLMMGQPAAMARNKSWGGCTLFWRQDSHAVFVTAGPPSAYDENGVLTVQLDQLHDLRLLRRAAGGTAAPKGPAPAGATQVTKNASPAPQTRVTKSSTPATATTLTEKQSVGPHTRSRSQQLQHTQGGSAGGQPRQVLDATASQQLTDRQTPQGAAGPSSSQHEQRSQSAMHLVSPAGPGQAGAPQPGSGAADGQATAKQGSQAVVQEESKVKKTSKKTKETKETVVEHKEESTGAGSEHHVSEGKHHRKEESAEEHDKEESTAVSRQQQGAQPDANGLAEMHWPLGESNGGQAQPGPYQQQQKQGQASTGGHPQENGSGNAQQHHQRGGRAADNGSPEGLQATPPARNLGPPVPAGGPCHVQHLECVTCRNPLCLLRWHVCSANLTHMGLLTFFLAVPCLPVTSCKATAMARAKLGAALSRPSALAHAHFCLQAAPRCLRRGPGRSLPSSLSSASGSSRTRLVPVRRAPARALLPRRQVGPHSRWAMPVRPARRPLLSRTAASLTVRPAIAQGHEGAPWAPFSSALGRASLIDRRSCKGRLYRHKGVCHRFIQ